MKRQKRRAKKRRIRLLPLLGMILFLSFIVSSGFRLWTLHREVYAEIERLNQEKAALLEEQRQLEEQIVKLNTPSYIEQLAREELGLVRPGEISIAPKKAN